MHFVQEQQQQQTFNFLKRTLTTSGAAILFCLVAMQRSVSDSESAPNTVTKRHKALLVTYHCVKKRYEALCNARLMQLIPDIDTLTVWFCRDRTLERGNSENNDQAAHSAVEIQVSGGPSLFTLTLTTQWTDSTNDKLMIFFQKIKSDISCKLSPSILSEKLGKYFKMTSAEIFTQHAKC